MTGNGWAEAEKRRQAKANPPVPCAFCAEASVYRCRWRVIPPNHGVPFLCLNPVCDYHAREVAEDRVYCQEHWSAWEKQGNASAAKADIDLAAYYADQHPELYNPTRVRTKPLKGIGELSRGASWHASPRKIDRVMRAFQGGCRSTREVSLLTGLPVKIASAYALKLVKRGVLVDKGQVAELDPDYVRGRKFHFYEPLEKGES